MNAIQLAILLHHYWSPEKYKSNTGNAEYSQAEKEGLNYLYSNGLLEKEAEASAKYSISEKGQVHIVALLDLPLPVLSWTSPIKAKV